MSTSEKEIIVIIYNPENEELTLKDRREIKSYLSSKFNEIASILDEYKVDVKVRFESLGAASAIIENADDIDALATALKPKKFTVNRNERMDLIAPVASV